MTSRPLLPSPVRAHALVAGTRVGASIDRPQPARNVDFAQSQNAQGNDSAVADRGGPASEDAVKG